MESFEDKLNGTVPPLVIGICILLILLGIGKRSVDRLHE